MGIITKLRWRLNVAEISVSCEETRQMLSPNPPTAWHSPNLWTNGRRYWFSHIALLRPATTVLHAYPLSGNLQLLCEYASVSLTSFRILYDTGMSRAVDMRRCRWWWWWKNGNKHTYKNTVNTVDHRASVFVCECVCGKLLWGLVKSTI